MGRDTVAGFAAAVRRLREANDWSLDDLAERSGIHRQSIAKIEREERAPSLRVARDIATALGVTVDEMCEKPADAVKRGPGRPTEPPAKPAKDKAAAKKPPKKK